MDGLDGSGQLGRVAVLDRHGGARRVLRVLRELAASGRLEATVALHEPSHRSARFVREADEAYELGGALDDALRHARATTAWLGPAPLEERVAFAVACEQAGVLPVGPGAATLRRLLEPRALVELAADAGVAPEDAEAKDPAARLVEVVIACDRSGATRIIGVGDASLALGDVAIFTESPAPGLGGNEEAAFSAAERAVAALGWTGVGAVRFAVTRGGRRIALSAIEPFARSAPAVEEASGVDLVRLAFRLAGGGAVERERPIWRGHALAARIQARDPEGDRPRTGKVELMRLPSGPGVRAHAALAEGDEAPPGAVLATVVAVGEARAEAAQRLELALSESDVLVRGSATSRAWLRGLLARPEVRGAEAARGFLDGFARRDEELVRRNPEIALVAAAIEVYEGELDGERARFIAGARRGRPRVGPSSGRTVELSWNGRRHRLEVRQTGPDAYRVTPAGGASTDVRVDHLGRAERRLTAHGQRWRILSTVDGLRHLVEVDGVPHAIDRTPAGIIASPMPAVVVAIPVTPGQHVFAGEPVARIESMKVEVVVTAPAAGVVREVLALPNAQVDAGAALLRLDAPGERRVEDAAPPPPKTPHAPEPEASPRIRYLVALDDFRRLVLGFDLPRAEAKRLASQWRATAAAVSREDRDVLRVEEEVTEAFADVQSLYSRTRPTDGDPDARPPLEELWRYLHEPERRAEGLSPRFAAALRRALSHYALSLDEPGRSLELALLRMQKAYERADEQLGPVIAMLERRLAGEGVPPGGGAGSRALADTLAEIGDERFPALADLARELRYRRFDEPALGEARRAAYAQAEADLAALGEAKGAERDALVDRLVGLTAPFATALVQRMAEAPRALRPRLVEILLRRYYRARPLSPAVAREEGGVACALADYAWAGDQFRAAACFARAADVAEAARQLSTMAAESPEERALVGELYLWHDADPLAKDAQAEALRAALRSVRWSRTPRRVSVVIALGGRGLGHRESQRHFTFRGDGDWTEDRRYRGIHPMLFRRMQLVRLENFDLERLPSAEDVYLYRGAAHGNAKDERLFAAAEVRDLTPVRDASGRVVQLPQLERVLNEALAGMRRFQAGRAPNQRLEWNRVLLTVTPPLLISREEIRALAERLAPATRGVGLEMVLIDAWVPDPATGEPVEALLRIVADDRGQISIRWDSPTDRPLLPMAEYQQRVVQLRRRGLAHPFEIVRQLAPDQAQPGVPRGSFVEHDLDSEGEALVPVERPPGTNPANIVAGVVTSYTDRHPEGMRRVVLLGDPSRAMGSLAEPECRRIVAALALADRLRVPVEWFAVSAGAKISMESGTENMDWISIVLRRIVEFTQRGGEINVVVTGINVGAQPYWNAEATMLMHTRGILVMTPGSAMVLTGKEALEYSGSVSAEDNQGIGGYDRIMGPNGQAQYRADSVRDAIQLLMRHYEHTYVAPGERFPRKARTSDPADRDVRSHPHGPAGGAGFETIGDVFSLDKNPDRKKPFDIRRVMSACVDQDHPPLERWRDLRGGDTAVVWDAHLGGRPVCLVGIESRPLPRLEFVPADGPELWSAGTLFPQSSKKIARALNAASGNRPAVVLANLSGFDGSPESMRRLQLEYGAEIGRAVVNFDGPIVFCVVSRYHGGAFVVFSKTLREDLEVVAVQGARASVIGGAPAAAVVFARDVETRLRRDPRVIEAEKAAAAGGAARARLDELVKAVRSEKVGEVAEEFDAIHTVERALKVGSLDRIIDPRHLRPYLVEAVERRIASYTGGVAR